MKKKVEEYMAPSSFDLVHFINGFAQHEVLTASILAACNVKQTGADFTSEY